MQEKISFLEVKLHDTEKRNRKEYNKEVKRLKKQLRQKNDLD